MEGFACRESLVKCATEATPHVTRMPSTLLQIFEKPLRLPVWQPVTRTARV